MKTKLIVLAGVFSVALAVSSCAEKKAEKNEDDIVEVRVDFEAERNEMRLEINKFEAEIDKEIKELEAKREKASAQTKAEIDEM